MIDDSTSQPANHHSPGVVLSTAREARGLSVEDVAAATRIRAQLVAEIERDQFDGCGGAIYARGHIRAIARVVGADADELVASFDESHGGAPAQRLEPGALPRLARSADRDIVRAAGASPRWASAAIAVLAVGAVFLVATWFLGHGGNGARQTASGPEPTVTADATDSATPSPTPTPPPTTTPPAQPGVSVQVQVTDDRSWVQVQDGTGAEIFARVLDAGQTMQWHDPRVLTLKFGNARVVEVTVNGRDLGAPCDRTVCTVRFPGTAAAG